MGGVSGASPRRGDGVGGVIVAWEGRHRGLNWCLVLVDAFSFVLVAVLFLVGGVTVDSVEELCWLVNPPEAKLEKNFERRESVESSSGHANMTSAWHCSLTTFLTTWVS